MIGFSRKPFDYFGVFRLNSFSMKPSPNPLAGIVDAMKAHDERLSQKVGPAKAVSITAEPPATPPTTVAVQTVAAISKPQSVGDKVFCAARFTRGQIEKVDQILFLTHKERGVRLTQSDVLKQAVERMPVASLEPGEVAEILAARGRKQFKR